MSAYAILIIASGSRLEALVTAVGVAFLLFHYRREWFAHHKIGLMVAGAAAILFLVLYGSLRDSARHGLATGEWNAPDLSLYSLFPTEAVTGYVPGFIVERAGRSSFDASYMKRALPRRLLDAGGVEKPATISMQLARYMWGADARAVYTITLPLDLMLAMGVPAVALVPGILYLLLYGAVRTASRRGPLGVGLAAVLYLNTYYIVRVEVGNWYARYWQDVLVYIAAATACWLVIALGRRVLSYSTAHSIPQSGRAPA